MNAESGAATNAGRVGVREDFFTTLEPPEQARLRGSRCRECGEVFLGRVTTCENCISGEMEETVLSRTGTLYSFTVIRARPPGDYKGPDNPFVPFAQGLVELPDGLRVLSKLTGCELDGFRIGMEMELALNTLYRDEEGREVMEFQFRPARREAGQ